MYDILLLHHEKLIASPVVDHVVEHFHVVDSSETFFVKLRHLILTGDDISLSEFVFHALKGFYEFQVVGKKRGRFLNISRHKGLSYEYL